MTTPLPARGSSNWYDWATRLDRSVNDLLSRGSSGINVKDYGAKGNGTADDTAAIQAALDAAAAAGGAAARFPAGTYRVTDTLRLPSRVAILGEGPWRSTITQATAGRPVIASRSWFAAANTSPAGSARVQGVRVVGSTGAGAHGIVLRDYYSLVEDVEVWDCGGDGVRLTPADDAGTELPGTLVENQVRNVTCTNCAGYGINAPSTSVKVTDGLLDNIIVQARLKTAGGSVGAIYLGHSSGWQLRALHTYGAFTTSAVTLRAMYFTQLTNAYIESGWAVSGLRLEAYQRAGQVDNVTVLCDAAGGTAVQVFKAGLYPTSGLAVGSLTVVQDNDAAVNAVTWDTTDAAVRISQLALQGDFAARIVPAAGFGKPAIRYQLPVTGENRLWEEGGAKTVTFTVTVPAFTSSIGTLMIGGAQFNNGALRASYVGQLLLSAKASTDAWAAHLTPVGTPVGFTTAPAVAVTGTGDTRTVTVTFTPSTADAYGASCALVLAPQ